MNASSSESSPVAFATSTVKSVLSGRSKIDKKILMTNGSLLKVESIAEWNILQSFDLH